MIYADDKRRIVPFEIAKHMNDRYRSWFHDPETTRHNSHGLFPYTPAQMRNFVSTIENGDPTKIVWAIESLFETIPSRVQWQHIGNVSLQGINLINRSAELAIVLGEERGRGHGVAVCRWVLDHAFLKLGLNRVWTGTALTNDGMRKTAAKIGMYEEGRFRDGMFLNGNFVDVIAFGITRLSYIELQMDNE